MRTILACKTLRFVDASLAFVAVGSTVTVQGYTSLFIQAVDHTATQDNVYSVVTQIGACGGGPTGPNSGNIATSGGGSFIPIRLIRTN